MGRGRVEMGGEGVNMVTAHSLYKILKDRTEKNKYGKAKKKQLAKKKNVS